MHSCLVCFPFLCWVKLCSGCFRQVFSFGRQKRWPLVALDSWLSYTVTIVWEFALVALDKCLSYRSSCLNRFDCNKKELAMFVPQISWPFEFHFYMSCWSPSCKYTFMPLFLALPFF